MDELSFSFIMEKCFKIISNFEEKMQNRMGYIYSLASILSLCYMSYIVKLLNTFSGMHLVAIRGVLGLVLMYVAMRQQNIAFFSNELE